MKKLQLNKDVIAQLNNSDKIYGGEAPCPLSEDSQTHPIATCGKTCDGADSCRCNTVYTGPAC